MDKRVTDYIKAVKTAIKKDYDKIPEEWSAQLLQLQNFYSAYLKCADALENEELIITTNAGKTSMPNPNIRLSMELQKAMDGIIKSFGLSPLAKSRIRANIQVGDAEDYLDTL